MLYDIHKAPECEVRRTTTVPVNPQPASLPTFSVQLPRKYPLGNCPYLVSEAALFQQDTNLSRVFVMWGGRRGLNPRHSVPQTDALPAELLPPLTDNKQFTLLFPCGKVGSMGQSGQLDCQLKRELKPTHATCTAGASACRGVPFSLTRDLSML